LIRRIDRYALKEMLVPALVGVVILLILLLGNWLYILLRMAYTAGTDPRDIVMILVYRLPSLLLQAIPGSLLLGTALALNRLERDRELLSLRLAGVRLTRLVAPYIVLGLLCSVFLFLLQEFVINKSTLNALKLERKVMFGSPTAAVQPDVMFKVGNNYLYAKRVDPATKMLYGVIVMRLEANGLTWMTIPMAENQDGRWIFHRDPYTGQPPTIYTFDNKGDLKLTRYITVEGVDHAESWLDLKENRDLWGYMVNQPTTPDAMTLRELTALKTGIRGPQLGGAYGTYIDPVKLDFYLHCKFSIPLSALVAVLIAIPFSVRFGRSGGYVGLLLAVVLSFLFVVSQQWARVLVETPSTHLPPILAAWAPDALFGLLGLWLLMREE
jgi:lipopolysaccharide export LptBFGC system permease protein LptF